MIPNSGMDAPYVIYIFKILICAWLILPQQRRENPLVLHHHLRGQLAAGLWVPWSPQM